MLCVFTILYYWLLRRTMTQITIYRVSKSRNYFSLIGGTYDSRARYDHISASLKSSVKNNSNFHELALDRSTVILEKFYLRASFNCSRSNAAVDLDVQPRIVLP